MRTKPLSKCSMSRENSTEQELYVAVPDGADGGVPIVLYEYQPDRKAEHAKKFLGSFSGYLHTDGYAGYHGLSDDIAVVGCWAHGRRKFDEAMKSLPKGKAKNSSAAQGMAYCNLLFKIEEGLAELTPEKRYDQRLKQEKPVLDAIWHGQMPGPRPNPL